MTLTQQSKAIFSDCNLEESVFPQNLITTVVSCHWNVILSETGLVLCGKRCS